MGAQGGSGGGGPGGPEGAERGPGPQGATSIRDRAPDLLWVLPTSELWEAGERPGSACAIEVEGLRRRPPT